MTALSPELFLQAVALLGGGIAVVWRTSAVVTGIKTDLTTMRVALEAKLEMQQQSLGQLRTELQRIHDRTTEIEQRFDTLRERVIILEQHSGGHRG